MRARYQGFTLIELLLVLFLIGLIAKVTSPTFSSADGMELEKAESFLLEAFRFARLEAMRTGQTCGVNIDTSTKRLRLYRYDVSQPTMAGRKYYTVNTSDSTKNACLMHPVTKAAFDQSYGPGTDYARLSLASASFRGVSGLDATVFRTGDVQFDPSGLPFVFNGANEPVPLTTPSPTTASPVVFSVGSIPARGLTICPFIGTVVIKKPNKDAADPCAPS